MYLSKCFSNKLMNKIKGFNSVNAFVSRQHKQEAAEPGSQKVAARNTKSFAGSKLHELGFSGSIVAARLHARDLPRRLGHESPDHSKRLNSNGEQYYRSLIAQVNCTGDVKLLDGIDFFRSELSSEEQTQYDSQLETLRADSRIKLFDSAGNEITDPALRDMALRGMLAATFGPPENPASGLPIRLEQTLDNAAALNLATATDGRIAGIVPIYIHEHNVPIGAHYPGVKSMEANILGDVVGMAGGLATPDGGIAIGLDAFYGYLASGENMFTHESGHVMQIPVAPADAYPFDEQPWPPGFPVQDVMNAYKPGRLKGAPDLGLDINNVNNVENFPLLLNMFTQHPEELRADYPQVYDAFVVYFGYDPLEGDK